MDDEEIYIDDEIIIDTQNIPDFTEDEAEDREYELIDENEEGGL